MVNKYECSRCGGSGEEPAVGDVIVRKRNVERGGVTMVDAEIRRPTGSNLTGNCRLRLGIFGIPVMEVQRKGKDRVWWSRCSQEEWDYCQSLPCKQHVRLDG